MYSDTEQPIRVFLAVPAPQHVQESVQGVIPNFAHVTDKMVPGSNWHITLAWLGEVMNPQQYVARLSKPLRQSFTPGFRLMYLGRGRKRDQLWAYVEKNQVLLNIREELLQRLKKMRFPIPAETIKQDFVPHIHVGDFYPAAGGVGLADVPLTVNFSVPAVILYSSLLTPQGVQYKPLCEIPFR